jgi:gamma-glutamylputrescine oxidase
MDETDTTSAYGQTWYAATKIDAPQRPPLTVDLDVDVCVIGGGLAGLTTAREIARSGWSVVLLESDRLAAHASGRNTGFVLPGYAAAPDRVIGRVGFERAKDLWALAQSGLDYVRNEIAENAMAGIDPQPGWLYVSKTDNGDEFTHLVGLLGEFGVEIEGWPVERVRALLRSERYFHAIHFPDALSIHPLNYALGLAAAAERAGARIFENTPVLSIDPAGVRKRIVTPNARLRANHVVLCGNFRIAALMRPVGAALIPITTYVITTAPLGERLAEAVGYRGAVSDSDLADNHYRIVGGDRLMWSGRATARQCDPRRYARALAADIKKTFPQLGEAAVDYAWSGTLGNSIHRMPQIGELGPGVWLASGFGGHGLNTTAMAGNLVARAIVEGDQTWRQFTPYELVWAGGIGGRAIGQVYYWTRRLRAALAERRARAAEVAHRARRAELVKTEQIVTEPMVTEPMEAEPALAEQPSEPLQHMAPAEDLTIERESDFVAPPVEMPSSADIGASAEADEAPAPSAEIPASAEAEPPPSASKGGKRRKRREQ